MTKRVGVLSVAHCVPAETRSVRELCREEHVEFTGELAERLGIDEVHLAAGRAGAESGSSLAVRAAREAIERAGIKGSEIDVVVDYSVMPQEYQVPVWNMGNKVQHEIGADESFVLGFSGGCASSFLVSLNAAAALIETHENIRTALLVGADVTIPGNRVLNPEHPVSVLGDGASAVILRGGLDRRIVTACEVRTEGRLHDVCFIPGGSLAHPGRADLYRMQLDRDRYESSGRMETLARHARAVLDRAGARVEDVARVVYPNISAEDQAAFEAALGVRIEASKRKKYGHMFGNDFAVNYPWEEQGLILLASHGMGFMPAVALIRGEPS